MTRVFLDLDGVMADFDTHYANLFGHYHKAIPDDELWGKIHATPSFFRDIPPFKDARAFYRRVENLLYDRFGYDGNVSILTACPKSAYAHVAGQKRGWVREHLCGNATVIPAAGGTSKPLFMHEPRDILIDDFERNTSAWEKAGGRAILHTGDLEASFQALQGMLIA